MRTDPNEKAPQTRIVNSARAVEANRRPQSVITSWLKGTPLEPLSQASPTKAAFTSGAICVVATVAIMTALNLLPKNATKNDRVPPPSQPLNRISQPVPASVTQVKESPQAASTTRKNNKGDKNKHANTTKLTAASPVSNQGAQPDTHTSAPKAAKVAVAPVPTKEPTPAPTAAPAPSPAPGPRVGHRPGDPERHGGAGDAPPNGFRGRRNVRIRVRSVTPRSDARSGAAPHGEPVQPQRRHRGATCAGRPGARG